MASLSLRNYELDWLRVFAFGILIFYHTGMLFVSWEWHIKNNQTSDIFEYVMVFFNRWRLPLLFFVSGASVFFALRKRTLGAFSRERFVRLFIPLLFGMFVVVPPQIYFERLQQGASFSYFDFYPSVFEFVGYPKGSFSWHHLWFVLYILIFSLVSLPLFSRFRSERGAAQLLKIGDRFSCHAWTYLFLLPLVLLHLILQPHFPHKNNLVNDWDNLLCSWYLFLLGYVFASDVRLMDALKRLRFLSLGLASAVSAIFYFFWLSQLLIPIFPEWKMRELIYIPINTLMGGFWLFAILGFARAHLTFSTPALTYANEAVYPFYILHQTVIVLIGFYVVQLPLGMMNKYLLISFGTLFLTLLCYESLKRNSVTRVLFGLKIP